MKDCYFEKHGENLPVFGISDDINVYITDEISFKNGINKKPADKFRLLNEDKFDIEETF